jgi:hypothetical protein
VSSEPLPVTPDYVVAGKRKAWLEYGPSEEYLKVISPDEAQEVLGKIAIVRPGLTVSCILVHVQGLFRH